MGDFVLVTMVDGLTNFLYQLFTSSFVHRAFLRNDAVEQLSALAEFGHEIDVPGRLKSLVILDYIRVI